MVLRLADNLECDARVHLLSETLQGLEVARQEEARQDATRLRDEIETMRILGL